MRPSKNSLASGSVGTPKLSEIAARAFPGWVTHWEKQNLECVVGTQSGQYCATVESSPGCGGGLGQDEAFWELTGFGFHGNSEVKRVCSRAIP
ncbi:hypothetical protein DVH24_035224 [Malus domestica]|uniref:Uncharacterized protein n=1 Tax=Malus domestica TaxID=3750 RepID=A0A498J4N4_MALDO|nr:hypothetical protein DVH24_035224 [Malus domestica]